MDALYTTKQFEILKRAKHRDWFMMINHGAIRAGKTVLDNDLFLRELKRVNRIAKEEKVLKPMYILGGTSAGTIHTNVIREIEDKYNINIKFDRFGNFALFGVYVVTTATGTIAGLKAIRGMTSYGAYINEATLANKEVFDEIVKRCSGLGARIILDTNPDNPSHWLKTDYIDEADGERIVANHFTIFDNNFLNKRFIDNIIATTPSGVFTERGIHGRWTIGEGAIYSDFDNNKHVVVRGDVNMRDIERYVVGVDWGYDHFGSMVVVGIAGDRYYVVEENAYRHLHIDDWVNVAQEIAEKYGGLIPFYCDSARPEYVDRLWSEGFNAMNANKAVLPGITEVATLIKSDKLFVVEGLERFNKEINEYVWNKTGDRPIDKMDDVLDGLRYAIYSDKMANENTILA